MCFSPKRPPTFLCQGYPPSVGPSTLPQGPGHPYPSATTAAPYYLTLVITDLSSPTSPPRAARAVGVAMLPGPRQRLRQRAAVGLRALCDLSHHPRRRGPQGSQRLLLETTETVSAQIWGSREGRGVSGWALEIGRCDGTVRYGAWGRVRETNFLLLAQGD